MIDLLHLFRRTAAIGSVPKGAPAGVPLLDPMGAAFELLRRSGVDGGMWRAELFEITPLGDEAVVLVAAYDAGDLEHAAHVVQTHPTIVIGVGMGEWLSARALSLGALGYAHDALDASAIRSRLADAFARHGHRRTRARQTLVAASV